MICPHCGSDRVPEGASACPACGGHMPTSAVRQTRISVDQRVDSVTGGAVTGTSIGQVHGDAQIVATGGGDYAAGNVDNRQGVFASGGTFQGPVIGQHTGPI